MKFAFTFAVFAALLALALGYTTSVQNAKHTDGSNRCLDKKTGNAYNIGNNPVPGKCERAHCDGNTWELSITGCQRPVADGGCSIKRGDSNRAYPDCCDKKVC